MKIGLFANAFFTDKGGIERLVSRLAPALLERGHQCHIFYTKPRYKNPIYKISQHIKTHELSFDDKNSLACSKNIVKKIN